MERLAAVLLVVGLGSAAASAEASILCKTQKGGLVVRDRGVYDEVRLWISVGDVGGDLRGAVGEQGGQ